MQTHTGPQPRPILLFASLFAVLVVTLALVATSAPAQAARGSSVARVAEAPAAGAIAARRVPIPGLPPECTGQPQRCEIGPQRQGAPTLVLWGDSHAWQLIPAVRGAIGSQRVNLVSFLYGGCPPHHTGMASAAEVRAASPCRKINYRALKYVTSQASKGRNIRVVLAGGWELYRYALNPTNPGGWQEETAPSIANAAKFTVRATPRLFRILGKKRIATDPVAQMPTVPTNAPPCPESERPYSCDLPRDAALPSSNYIRAYLNRQRAQLTRTGGLIDPTAYFCSRDLCAGKIGGKSIYYDTTHISTSLSARLRSYFVPTVNRLVSR